MIIVRGRGKKRKMVLEIPHSSIIKRSPDQEQAAFIGLVCNILKVENRA